MKFGCIKSRIPPNINEYKPTVSNLPGSYSYIDSMPPVMDQGQTSKCVAYALSAWLQWRASINGNMSHRFSVDKIYDCRSDKAADGMEIIEALRFLEKDTEHDWHIKDFSKIGAVEYIKAAIISQGPVIAGMYAKSDNDDFWHGRILLGGHCVLFCGYDMIGFIIRNSWGRSWGNAGYTRIPYNEIIGSVFELWTILS